MNARRIRWSVATEVSFVDADGEMKQVAVDAG